MSSENETTATTSENKTAENKRVFAPLGKYAVIAVLMVSIIITTAIMLDRQLSTVDTNIAAIESEIAEIQDANQTKVEETGITENSTSDAAEAFAMETLTESDPVTTEVATSTESETTSQAAEETLVTVETENKAEVTAVIDSKTATTITEADARFASAKSQQKQHITQMLERIKVLETEQLDRYKQQQNEQIIRLREQLAQQQAIIETLINRKQDLYQLRETAIQRNQANREEIYNRI